MAKGDCRTAELPNCQIASESGGKTVRRATRLSHPLRVVVSVLVIAFFGFGHSAACTFASRPQPVRLPLKIHVVDEGKPVVGITAVVLAWDGEKSKVVISGATDADGSLVVTNLPPGRYFAGIQHPSGDRNEEIVVAPGAPPRHAKAKLDFEWPGSEKLETQRLVGRIRAPQITGNLIQDLLHPQFQLFPAAILKILEPVSYRVVATTSTDARGEYSFENLLSGDYFLQILRPGDAKFATWQVDIPVRLSPAAKAIVLDLDVHRGICGSSTASRAE